MESSVLRTRPRASTLLNGLMATLMAAACASPLPAERSPSSAGMQPAKLSPARAGTLKACADRVTTFGHAATATATAIDSAQRVAAGPVRPSTIAQPEHCLVTGRPRARGCPGPRFRDRPRDAPAGHLERPPPPPGQ
jgi:hypothetical protein